jgi:hypothetical protein
VFVRAQCLTFSELPTSNVFQDRGVCEIQATHCVTENVSEVIESTLPRTGSCELFSRHDIQSQISQRSLKTTSTSRCQRTCAWYVCYDYSPVQCKVEAVERNDGDGNGGTFDLCETSKFELRRPSTGEIHKYVQVPASSDPNRQPRLGTSQPEYQQEVR